MLHKKDYVMIVENSGSTLKINENTVKSTKLQLEGKFTEFDIENRNKRMYSADKFIPYMNALLEKKKTLGVLYGEYDHPDVFDVTCKNLSHVIDSLTHNESNNCIDGSITLLNNSWGKEARSIIEDGYPLFVSSRAAGVTESNGMVQLKELFTYDIVADPGFASARVTPKIMNESLGFGVTDDVPYRIYKMDETHVNALFGDNKNDKQTEMDIKQFEAFLQGELTKFEFQLMEKLGSKQYAPEEAKTLVEQIDFLKSEITGVNKILEFFRSKINTLITDNSKLKDNNKKLQHEVSENLMHSNHISTQLRKISTYATQIDERLNLSEGLLEHVAKHTEANIFFSKDIANNLSETAKEMSATQGLLEHVASHVKTNEEALLFAINETCNMKEFVEDMAKEVEATQGLLEHTAKEANNDSIWLTYIHEKVDGVVSYTNELVTSLKNDNKKLLKENINSTTEINKLDTIEDYLGLVDEQNLVNNIQAETKIAAISTKIAVNEEEENELDAQAQVQPEGTTPVQPEMNVQVQPEFGQTVQPEAGITQVQPEMNVQIDPLANIQVQPEGMPMQVQPEATVLVQPEMPISGEQPEADSLEAKFLNQLVKIISDDNTGIVVEITPDNKLTIQMSGSDDTVSLTEEEIERLDVTDDNIVETVNNLVGQINKHRALAIKEPHFFTMLADKQIVEFKQLDQDTQAKIILMMEEKEYYNSNDVLNHISQFMSEKTMNREERLVSCLPAELKESWDALEEKNKTEIIAESAYFPIRTEIDMINFWNTRTFVKTADTQTAINEKIVINYEQEADSFMNAFNNLK